MSVKHDHTLNSVTAAAFFSQPGGPLLLTAEGICLKVFDVGKAQLIAQFKVFKEQTIHGIAVHDNHDRVGSLQLVIWGGPSLSILYQSDLVGILESRVFDISSKEWVTPDWILSVTLSPNTKDFMLLTAHNSLLKVNFVSNQNEPLLETLDSPSRSILYSAHMIWESSNSIMVAAGTVFGKIIVWQCYLREAAKATVLFTFTGHEGSIFGVHISPKFRDSRGKAKRLLSSCSDDRTIRLWDLSEEATREENSLDSVDQRPCETSPGKNGDSLGSSTQSRNKCLAATWGHASRIWRVHTQIFGQGDAYPKRLNLLSFGEDATCQLWSVDFQALLDSLHGEECIDGVPKPPNAFSPKELLIRHRRTFEYHSGKHIWAADVYPLQGSSCLVATGGADGKLCCFEISLAMVDSAMALSEAPSTAPGATDSRYESWTLGDIFATFTTNENQFSTVSSNKIEVNADIIDGEHEVSQKQKKLKKTPKDGLNRYSFITDRIILLTTTAGRVLLGMHQQEKEIFWEELQMPEQSLDLRGYSVVTSVPELELAVFAGGNGKIYKYRNGHRIDQIGSVKGKVAALFLTRNQNDGLLIHLLVTVLGGSEASLFSWHENSASETIQSSPVSLPPNFVVTGAEEIGSLVYLGSRNGAIGVLNPNEPREITCTYCPPAREDADAITSIIEIPTKRLDSSVYHAIATSRNGTYKILSISTDNHSDGLSANLSIILSHHSSPPLGSIEDAWFEGSTLYLSGFRGKQFIIWNETQQSETMAIECGGAHRSYAYCHFSSTLGGGTFVYTQASTLCLHHQQTGSHRIIKDGGHGREIKACAVSSGYKYLATGAEDTTLRLWNYHEAIEGSIDSKFECLAVVEKHTAGIQHLQWHGTDYLFSSGGLEEFYVWAIQEIPGFGVGIICEASLLDKSPEKDLRIMSFDVKEFSDSDTRPDDALPETTFLISLAYSDSTIKCYLYSKSNGFHLAAEGKYTSNCLTQIRYVPYPPLSVYEEETPEGTTVHSGIALLTAGTDGHLTMWIFHLLGLGYGQPSSNLIIAAKRTSKIRMFKSHKVHQNSIKSMNLISISELSCVIATGGDDNAIAITYFDFLIDVPMTTIVKSGHGAAVTALALWKTNLGEEQPAQPSKRKCGLRLVTSSNDQRLKVWDVTVLEDGFHTFIDVKVVGDEFTAVADVGDMAVIREQTVARKGVEGQRKIVVVGNGMDVWTI